MIQDAILKLQKLGAPSEGFEDSGIYADDEIDKLWYDWIEAVDNIKCPVTWE